MRPLSIPIRKTAMCALTVLLLSGCGSWPGSRSSVEPAVVETPPAEPAVVNPPPDPEALAAEAREGGPTLEVAPLENPAVAQLVEQAETQRGAGDLAAASALLERGLRLEPENPRLWQRLAEIRLAQGEYLQAEEMAMRSLGHSARVGEWCRRNWLTLRATREALGDPVEAERAAAQATSCQVPPPPRF